MKLNIKGVIALLVFIGAIVFLLVDFYKLTQGYQYTWFGVSTLGIVLLLGSWAEDYIHERINRR